MSTVPFDFTIDQISSNDPSGFTIDQNEIHHFVTVVHFYFSTTDLPVHCRIGPQQQLLSSLSFSVEGSGNQYPSKRAVVQQAAIVPGKGNPLGNTLINDIGRNLCQTINIGFSGTVIPSLDGIVKKSVGRITIPLIVFCGIDPSLGSDRMRSSWRILKTKCFDIVTQFGQSRRGRCSCQTGTHHNDIDQTLVGRTDKVDFTLMVGPFFGQTSLGYF